MQVATNEGVVQDDGPSLGQQFLDVLRNDEELLDSCGASLLGVIETLKATGGKGKVTLALTITQPKKKGVGEQVWIEGAVSSTAPKPAHESHMFYAVEGRLSKRDPRQPDLFKPRAVAAEEGEGAQEEAAL